jgi:integrase
MQKIDPYKSKERFEKWKETKMDSISDKNFKLLREYVFDMERGINVSSTHKGTRSAIRLLSLVSRLKKIMELADNKFKIKDITKIKSSQVHDLFLDMQSGKIKKSCGGLYLNVEDYIKRFKSFWHWYIKKNKKEMIDIPDITEDLTSERRHKPNFVYFTKEQFEKMLEIAGYDTKAVMLFMFDTGIRSPTELQNIRVSDFSNDFKEVNIREETSKTFGRKIKLMLCSDVIRKYIRDNNFEGDDLLFTFNPATMNKRLKLIGRKILNNKMTLGRGYGNELTMYDFRHSSACFWLPKYKSRSALLYRFGWKKEEEINYYTELLGMKDTISEEDMLTGVDKTEFEKEMKKLKEEMNELKSDFNLQTKWIKQRMTPKELNSAVALLRKLIEVKH